MWKYFIANIYISILLKYHYCCLCYEKGDRGVDPTSSTDSAILKDKRALSVDILTENTTEHNTITSTSIDMDTSTVPTVFNDKTPTESIPELQTITETTTEEAVETVTTTIYLSPTVTIETNTTEIDTDICPSFTNISVDGFDLQKIADVWQILYYQMPEKLNCFKIHIKILTVEQRQNLANTYGNFNNSVNWDQCVLELKSTETTDGLTRHFLQTTSIYGVMENIIIEEDHSQNTTTFILHLEAPDQWVVINNLLLMKDCDQGYVAIFSRVPSEPLRQDVLDILTVFGDEGTNGTLACDETVHNNWLKG